MILHSQDPNGPLHTLFHSVVLSALQDSGISRSLSYMELPYSHKTVCIQLQTVPWGTLGHSAPHVGLLGTDADIAHSWDGKRLPLDTGILIYILDHKIHYHTRGCRFSPDSQVCTHTFHDVDGTQACFVAHTDTRMSSQIHTTTWGKLEKTLCWTFLECFKQI